MKEFIEFIVKHLVENPDQVVVTTTESEGRFHYKVTVGPGDMGRVIGREGRIAKAIRIILIAAASRRGQQVTLDIVD
jgi:predicted RNA-binding protein YlqC (UPF0109 family)